MSDYDKGVISSPSTLSYFKQLFSGRLKLKTSRKHNGYYLYFLNRADNIGIKGEIAEINHFVHSMFSKSFALRKGFCLVYKNNCIIF